jgi:ubiquinone/menaquinone biosynthesis C-methylase UbiE
MISSPYYQAGRGLCRFGRSLGIRLLRRGVYRDGLRLLLEPLTYWRNVEAPYVIVHLRPRPGQLILDVGSPKLVALFLSSRDALVEATDLYPYFIELCQRAKKCDKKLNAYLRLGIADGRALPYPDRTFDSAYALSVVEHIENEGDTRAIREMARVLKPGGRLCLTVPFAHEYRESMTTEPLYYKQGGPAAPVFYQRHYDVRALEQRIIKPSGLTVIHQSFYGERYVAVEEALERLPVPLRAGIGPMLPILSACFLTRLNEAKLDQAMTACLTLEKVPQAVGPKS